MSSAIISFPLLGISLDPASTIKIGSFTIHWYGVIIAVGFLLAVAYALKRGNEFGLTQDDIIDMLLWAVPTAIVCARLYYVIFTPDEYFGAGKWINIVKIWNGGLAIYGGLIGAILVGGIVAKLRKLKLTALLDIVAPCFFIGQAIGRWGNFVNQEAFGSNTNLPWGMMSSTTMNFIADHYDDLGGKVSSYAPVHPCFLYESLWCIIGFVLLHLYLKHRKFDGEVFLMYIGWYGLGRFFIEATRTDSLYLANIKISQLVAGTCVLVSIVLIIIFRSMVKRNDDYKLFCETETSKAQLSQYEHYDENRKAKKELKNKIKEAKSKGESFVELEKEYDEKFGKNSKHNDEETKSENAEDEKKDDGYKSILSEDEDADNRENTEENKDE